MVGGDRPGRRDNLEVLNKSGIVLTCSIWEAYVEDLIEEVVEHYVTHVADATALPTDVQERVAKELAAESDMTAMWKLAGDGWKTYLRDRLKAYAAQRNSGMNTPKAAPVDKLFLGAVGIAHVTSAWSWSNMQPPRAAEKLDALVTLRGDIAHRGTGARRVHKANVLDYGAHVQGLVMTTDKHVNAAVAAQIGVALFTTDPSD